VIVRRAGARKILAALLATLVAGCNGSERPPSDGLAAEAARPSEVTVKVVERVRIVRDGPALSLDQNRITFPTDTQDDGLFDAVEVLELDHRKRRIAARTSHPQGFINWAVSSGDWTVYVDQSAEQSDLNPTVLWQILAINRVTNERKTLASNGATPDAFVPRVLSADGYVFWGSAESDRSVRESVWKPGWVRPRNVLRRAQLVPTSESIDDGWLYYLAPPGSGSTDARASDCWRVRINGSGAEQLTRSGLVMSCSADRGRLVWTNHIDPAASVEEANDDPYELWTSSPEQEPQLLQRGHFSSSVPVIAGDYVVWQDAHFVLNITSLKWPALGQRFPGTSTVESALFQDGRLVLLTLEGDYVVANIATINAGDRAASSQPSAGRARSNRYPRTGPASPIVMTCT